MKRAVIFIDTEAGFEGPWRQDLDFEEGIKRICLVLKRHKAQAVFNACGKLIEEFPQTFRNLKEESHEVALHGWKHENLRLLDDEWLERVLSRSHEAFRKMMGDQPYGFRAPWLEYDDRLISWLAKNGYRWVSHRHIFYRERFFTPAARQELSASRKVAGLWARWHEARFSKLPNKNDQGLWEIPLSSSMDGELLGLVSPLQPSPQEVLEFAKIAWNSQMKRSEDLFTLNIHDWLIASANRLTLLDEILLSITKSGYQIITANKAI